MEYISNYFKIHNFTIKRLIRKFSQFFIINFRHENLSTLLKTLILFSSLFSLKNRDIIK